MIDPKSTCLLVVDMQNAFAHLDGELAKAGRDISQTRATIPKILKLVKSCRENGIHIIWIVQESFIHDTIREQRKLSTHVTAEKIPALKGSWSAEIVDELKQVVSTDDDIIKKHRYSSFYGTNLEVRLRILGTRTLIVTGTGTNVCVESTVRDASFRDYDVILVEDCVGGTDKELHESTLKNVRLFFGTVIPSEDILNEIDSLRST
jgi:ureidoacrylate peracid hydrolase